MDWVAAPETPSSRRVLRRRCSLLPPSCASLSLFLRLQPPVDALSTVQNQTTNPCYRRADSSATPSIQSSSRSPELMGQLSLRQIIFQHHHSYLPSLVGRLEGQSRQIQLSFLSALNCRQKSEEIPAWIAASVVQLEFLSASVRGQLFTWC